MLQIFENIGDHIWNLKYKYKTDNSINDTFERVVNGLTEDSKERKEFLELLKDRLFCPGGRILSTIGTNRKNATNMNCFIQKNPSDSMSGIMDNLKECALTLRTGGGIGVCYDYLRPNGADVVGVEGESSGPIAFMQIWDTMCKTISSAGSRRGGIMMDMSWQHPDIFDFINCKKKSGHITQANISVCITKELIDAALNNENVNLFHWVKSAHVLSHMKPIIIPSFDNHEGNPYHFIKQKDLCRGNSFPCYFNWGGKGFETKIYKTTPAKDIINAIIDNMNADVNGGEPGILFIDKINELNQISYSEDCSVTNVCGEVYGGPYTACLLGSINLVTHYDAKSKEFDFNKFENTIRKSVRFLGKVSFSAKVPLKQHEDNNDAKHKMGLGITGLADLLSLLRIKYGSPESIKFINNLCSFLANTAWDENAELSCSYGKFKLYNNKILDSKIIKQLTNKVQEKIKKNGLAFAAMLSLAPTGTISNLLGNVSSGLEPIFNKEYERKIKCDKWYELKVTLDDNTVWLCTQKERMETFNFTDRIIKEEKIDLIKMDDGSPAYTVIVKDWVAANYPETVNFEEYVTIKDLLVSDHLNVLSTIQNWFDLNCSKTINLPSDFKTKDLETLIYDAYKSNAKGLTVYRDGTRQGVLTDINPQKKEKKRPKSLPCEIFHIKISKRLDKIRTLQYAVIVGLDSENYPYEVFAFENGELDPNIKRGEIVRTSSGKYDLMCLDKVLCHNITSDTTAEEDIVTRLISLSLQSKVPIEDIITQLGKAEDGILSFTKSISRALKTYVKDGSTSKIQCPQCGENKVQYISGCPTCSECGWSRCS